MKKLLSILALALCFVACQNEPEVNVSNSDLVDVVLNIEAPELGITRAGADGEDDSKNAKNSAYGAIDYADDAFWGEYDLRYTLEVYAENDSDGSEGPIAKERLVNYLDRYAQTTFKLRLVPNRTYKFVVFADFVAQDSKENLYYDTEKLTAITSLTRGTQWNAMNEARDAYFITENIHVTTGLEQKLILTRPFAKVRVVTTDILDLEKYATPAKVVVTYYNHPIYKSFNAVNGAISTEMTGNELTHVVKYDGQYDAGYDSEDSGCMTLFADYIHAIADQQSNINFRMDVFDLSGRLLKSNDFSTEIPVQRNHLTTLMGNVLTTEATVQILISDEFVGDYKETVPDRKFDNDTIIVTGFENGGKYANGAYSYKVSNANTGESFTLNIKDSALKNGTLQKGEYEYGTHFTATNVMVNIPLTRAAVAATAEGGKMVVDIDENNKYTIAIDLVVKDDANNAIYPSFGYYGDFAIEAAKALAAPANFEGAVDGEKVTFTWSAVEKATSYDVVFNGITATISKDTTATFTVQATDEEQKLTASIVAKADGYKTSDAATCEVVIPAKVVEPAEPVILYLQPNANWNKDNARFAAYFFNNDGNTSWADMTLVEGETNIYTVTVPAGFDNIIFCRMSPTATENNWDNRMNQTVDLKVPTDGTNLYTVTEGAWSNGEGTWSIYTVATEPEEPETPVYTSVADFLDAAEDETIYTLKGTITRVANTTYGNFDLTDDTGTVYIYGLCSPEGVQKYWAESGAKLGDDIVVKTKRSSFNSTPQGEDAIFVELLTGTRAFWSFDKDNVVFGSAEAAELTVNVEAYNTTDAIVASSNNDHFTASYADGVVTIATAENTTYEKIEGVITVTCGELYKEITVSQAALQDPDDVLVAGEQYSYTFTKSVFSANGTKALGSLNWTIAGDGGYWGWDSNNSKGQQLGSSSKPYTSLTMSTEDYTEGVASITINTAGASGTNAKLEVYVGGVKLGQTVSLDTSSKDYTFSNDGEVLTGKIEFKYTQTSKKALYIKAITIN